MSLWLSPVPVWTRTLLLLLPLCAPWPPACAAAPATAAVAIASDPEVLGAERVFSAWLEAQIAYRGLPGVAVGVVRDQQLVWSQGFGFADVQARLPMTATTKFRMASNSKMLTAVAIMQLREEGKLRLDDPVVQYLPWCKAKPAGADDGLITIEQLLSHSAGLPREAGDHWSSHQFPTTTELEQLYPQRQAAFAPQTRWKYSNLAFALAGQVIEQVSGLSWAAYVQKNIFDPLGMRSSSRCVLHSGGRRRCAKAGPVRSQYSPYSVREDLERSFYNPGRAEYPDSDCRRYTRPNTASRDTSHPAESQSATGVRRSYN